MWNNIFINYLQSVVGKIIDYSYCTINPKACRFIAKLRRLRNISLKSYITYNLYMYRVIESKFKRKFKIFLEKYLLLKYIYSYRLILIQFLKNWNFSNFTNNSKIIKQFLFKYAVLSLYIFSAYITSYNFH